MRSYSRERPLHMPKVSEAPARKCQSSTCTTSSTSTTSTPSLKADDSNLRRLTTENKTNFSDEEGMSSVYFLAECVLKRSNLLLAIIEKKGIKNLLHHRKGEEEVEEVKVEEFTPKNISIYNSNLLELYPEL